jgi:hypothetical protein
MLGERGYGMSSSHDEIAEEICDNLRPPKGGVGDLHSVVIKRIELINEVYPKLQPVSRMRLIKLKATKADNVAAALQAAIRELQDVFEPAVLPLVQTHELNGHLRTLRQTLALLKHCRGPDPRLDTLKWLCANVAYGLILEFSKRAPTGTSDGPFRTTTALLYTAITGKDGDLKRACDAQLRWRKTA